MTRQVLAAAAVIGIALSACSGSMQRNLRVASGSERSAPELMRQYGCPACHTIPHVPGAVGKVGPSLESLDHRSFLAGVLQNTPENLRNWIMHPQHYEPGTAMPEMGVTSPDAERIAEFLERNR
jgi:cytochrome c